MAYGAFPFPTFGLGANLRDKEDAVQPGEAIDLLNVEFTQRGAIKQRDGYTHFATLTNPPASFQTFYTTSGTRQLIAGCGTRLEAIASDGTPTSLTGQTDGAWDFARFGSPNNERVYAGQGETTLRKWDGTSWTNGIAGTPKAGALAVMPVSNRLVAARFNTTTGSPTGGISSPSHVFFSDAGDPETWTSTNFIQLTPSDGEKIQAIIAWREFIMVFKETKYFVFYGESIDGGGEPIFDYRTVDTGIGLASPRAIIASHSGVYFMARTGVYRTTGQEPELLSDPVDPIFNGGASGYYMGGELAHGGITNCALGWHNERLYLGFPSVSSNDRTLIHDPRYGWWTLYDFPATCLASFRIGSEDELVFGKSSGHVERHNADESSDVGTAIASRWRSGFMDLGVSAEKVSRAQIVWGSGKVFGGVSADFEAGTGTTIEIDLTPPEITGSLFGGTGTFGGADYFGDSPPGLVEKQRRIASQGTVFSLSLTNNVLDQGWKVDRFAYLLRPARRPSAQRPSAA